MNKRCKNCKWIDEKEDFSGKVIWCGAKSEETTLNGYCKNFKYKLKKDK